MMMTMNDDEEYSHPPVLPKKRKSKNKQRFSDEQIKSLETTFESETKLEPRKKLQLARDLGLQPRQVAIWFQNRRARYKSKLLERDYSILRANYSSLSSQFDALKKEKQALQAQLQKLNDQMKKSQEGSRSDSGDEVKNALGSNPTEFEGKLDHRIGVLSDDNSSIWAEKYGLDEEVKPSLSFERTDHHVGVLSDADSSMRAEYFGLDEEPELLSMVDPADSTLTSPENWGGLNSNGLLDQSGSSCQWWDFWS